MSEAPAKKVHWTKRPENKEKVAKMIAKGKKTQRKKPKHSNIRRQTNDGSSSRQEIPIAETPVFAYALGHVESWIETYAKSADIPSETLARELGKVLQIKARR